MESGELSCSTCFGTLTVNSVLLNGPAWCAYDLTTLLDEADLRGSDRLIPSLAGVVANKRRRTVTRKDFPVAITGLYNRLGVRQTDRAMGLIANIEYLKDNLGFASTGTGGTVTASWLRSDGTTRSASVHVLSLKHALLPANKKRGIYVSNAVLSLSIPAGRFA